MFPIFYRDGAEYTPTKRGYSAAVLFRKIWRMQPATSDVQLPQHEGIRRSMHEKLIHTWLAGCRLREAASFRTLRLVTITSQ